MKRLIALMVAASALLPGQWRKFGSGGVTVATSPLPVQTSVTRPLELPAGLLLSLRVNEHVNSRLLQPNEPILFEVANAARPFRSGPALPSGSLITARVVEAKPAGRIVGRATLDIAFDEILLPSGERYPLSAKIIEARGLGTDSSGRLIGRGHAKADAFFYTFPLTSPFRVMMIPARGPDIRFKGEQSVTIKLMEPVMIGAGQ